MILCEKLHVLHSPPFPQNGNSASCCVASLCQECDIGCVRKGVCGGVRCWMGAAGQGVKQGVRTVNIHACHHHPAPNNNMHKKGMICRCKPACCVTATSHTHTITLPGGVAQTPHHVLYTVRNLNNRLRKSDGVGGRQQYNTTVYTQSFSTPTNTHTRPRPHTHTHTHTRTHLLEVCLNPLTRVQHRRRGHVSRIVLRRACKRLQVLPPTRQVSVGQFALVGCCPDGENDIFLLGAVETHGVHQHCCW